MCYYRTYHALKRFGESTQNIKSYEHENLESSTGGHADPASLKREIHYKGWCKKNVGYLIFFKNNGRKQKMMNGMISMRKYGDFWIDTA